MREHVVRVHHISAEALVNESLRDAGVEEGAPGADSALLGDRVRMLGAIPHGDLPGLLAAADLMALASASEGLANAWVEALACGTPIVITGAGGAMEVVTDAAYGQIADRTPPAFAAAIAALLADPPPPAAVRTGAARFTWAANTAALVDHLSQLVSLRR